MGGASNAGLTQPLLRLRTGVAGHRVAACWGPPVDRHQATFDIPVNEHCLPDVQGEHDCLFRCASQPPGVSCRSAQVLAGFDRWPIQLELSLCAVGAVTTLCSTYRGSRRRSVVFADQAMAPMIDWPAARWGSMGLMPGICRGAACPAAPRVPRIDRARPTAQAQARPVPHPASLPVPLQKPTWIL